MRLITKLVILLITAVLVPIVVVSVVLINIHQQAYTAAILTQEEELASRLAHDIDHFMRDKQEMLKVVSSAFFLQAMSRSTVDFLLALLLKTHLDLRWIALVDLHKHERTRLSRTEAVLENDLRDLAGDPLLEVALGGDLVTSPVFFSAANEPFIMTYIPMQLYEGHILGVVVAEIGLKSLWEQVLQAQVAHGGFALVVAGDGTVIAHPEKLVVLQKQQFADTSVRQHVLAGSRGTATYDDPFLQAAVVAAFVPLQAIAGTVIVVQPQHHIFAVARTLLLHMVSIAGVCLIIALCIGSLFGYRLVKPILRLIRDIQSMYRTEGSAVPPPGGQSRNEMAVLTHSFREMMRVLQARHRDLEAAKAYEERFRHLVEGSIQGIVIHRDFKPLFANQAYATILGYDTPDDILRLDSLLPCLAPQEHVRVSSYVQARHAGKRVPEHQEHRALRRDGTRIWLDVKIREVLWNGAPAIQATIFDITEQKRAEAALSQAHEALERRVAERTADLQRINRALQAEIAERKHVETALRASEAQLRQAQKMEAIGTLAGGIAHDFNNILTTILGYTELTTAQIPQNSVPAQYLQAVLVAGYRARDLVQQILTFGRQGSQERKPVQLHMLLQDTLPLLRASLPSTIEIQLRINTATDTVWADTTQMHQILLNLCANAEHAMRETGGVLEVRLDHVEVDAALAAHCPDLHAGPYVRLTVQDTGYGMAPEVMPRIFEPFFTTKAVGEGTGLGLAVVHGIVASHGGAILVDSTVGHGSTFTVYLPHIDQQTGIVQSARAPLLPGTGRILLVDDEETLVSLGQEMLTHLGYEVVGYSSSVEALQAFRAMPERFDLVITDQTMPTLTGEMLAQELHGIRADIPIVLCTGLRHAIDPEKASAVGITALCTKPFVMQELAATLRHVLAQRVALGSAGDS